MTIEKVVHLAEAWMDEIEGVIGVAQGKDGAEDCITVFVTMKSAADNLPGRFHGFKVVTEETGNFDAQLS